jgi:hypothetical protein
MLAVAIALCAPAAAGAAPSIKKAIWGPVKVNGKSQFPIYRDLGVGIYQLTLDWNEVALTPPADPTNPDDPAYTWPARLDFAVEQAKRYGIQVCVQVLYSPGWANGGRAKQWAPRPSHYADFMTAAARRYTSVRHWMVWGEPSRQYNFRPLPPHRPTGPRRYSRILDAAYEALKNVRKSNIVIGGNTFTSGAVRPLGFIRSMRLPDGRPPRMDMYGHNPFTIRRPTLAQKDLGHGYADFGDLDTLATWVDRYLGRTDGHRIKLFISEFTLPTDHANEMFNFHLTRPGQAAWLSEALRVAKSWRRIYTLGWYSLYDPPPNGPQGQPGTETNWGLLDWRGRPKPSYRAYKKG